MEPVKLVTVTCLQECLEGIYTLLSRRRAHVISEQPNPGSPLFTLKAHVPTIDTFGMETDLRLHTMGQATVIQIHDHWQTLLADPLDKDVVFTPL
jgi:U5 small nuclear ribonucleoprotein component